MRFQAHPLKHDLLKANHVEIESNKLLSSISNHANRQITFITNFGLLLLISKSENL